MDDGAIIRFDLFAGGTSDRFLVTGVITQTSGTSIIDINSLVTGSYNLGNLKDLNGAATVSIAGVDQVAGARQTATLNVDADDLILIAGADISRALAWNVASGTWNTSADNWAGSASVTKFAPGDRVVFGNASESTITLASTADIKVADMKVDSAANHTFDGAAGIIADPASVNPGDGTDPNRVTDATGRLVKMGAGMLTFSNSGTNTFKGGIALGGGTLAFARAAQIDTTGTSIQVTGNATLRANADIDGLANAIAIDAGQTLSFDTQTHNATHTGVLSSAGTFAKTGAGTLTLTGNSSAFTGATQVNAGRLTLDNARLGGTLTLASGATLAGAGTAGTGAFNAAAGSIIDVGLSAAASGTLAFGSLTLDTATLKFDLFGLQNGTYVSDQITGGGLTLVNTSTVQIGAFQTGTYTLGVITGLNGVTNLSANLSLRIENSGRQSGALSVLGTDKLTLTTMADISRELAWDGSGATWTDAGAWTGTGGVDQYASGDRVRFDHTAAPANRAVALTGTVHVSDLLVSEDGYTFAGDGGITSGTRYVSNSGVAEFGDTATGRLVKTGPGALTFANTGGNNFEDGIDIGNSTETGGLIVFNNVNQLRTGSTAAIHFVNTGTLRAASAMVSGTLIANLAIADTKTAVLDTQGGTLAYSGALSGGAGAIFAQGGPGDTLFLSGNSSAYEGITEVTGAMLLAGGTLGGTVNVASGATFGGRGAATGVNGMRVADGATIQIGMPGGDGTETFHAANLQLANGATVTGHGIWSGSAQVAASGTATANIAGGKVVVLAATIAGDGDFIKTGAGTLDVTSGKIQAGKAGVQDGTLHISGDSVNVTGFGIGAAGMLRGSGTLAVGPDGFRNAGAIMIGRAGGDTNFAVISIQGNYASSEGQLSLAIGNAAAKKDVLNINGTVTGSTDVTIIEVESITTAANLPANLITINGGLAGITDGMFHILGSGVTVADSGYLYNYDPMTGLWSASGVPVPAVPAVTGLDAAALLVGKASFASLSRRLMSSLDNAVPHDLQLWTNGLYRHDKLTAGTYNGAVNSTAGVQVGADWTCRVNNSDTLLTLGVFYDCAKADMDQSRSLSSSDTEANGAGVYALIRGGKWYLDGIFRGAGQNYTISVPGKPDFTTKGDSWAGAVGIGYVMTDKSGWNLEPQIQLIYQTNYIDDAVDSQGLVYRVNGAESLDGRIGFRLWEQFQWKSGRILAPYARVSLIHEFKGDSEVLVSDDIFVNSLGGSGFMADAGIAMQLTRALFANAQASWFYNSKIESYSFNLGISCAW
jgi:outer membrane autotransporter protein